MKKHIKKILILALIIISVVSMSGCGMRTASIPTENKIKVSEMTETSSGIGAICKTLKDREYVSDDCIKTDASLIGAESGYRFDKVKVNGSIFSVELYEYKDNKSNISKEVIDSVKKNSSFDMFGRVVSYCYMSDNEKYLLIYPDSKSTSGKGDDTENATKLKEILEIINSQN